MKRNFLKRSMALAVAVAMTASSLPTSFAFAEEEIVMEEVALDAAVEEEADVLVEEPAVAEAEVAVSEEVAADEFVMDIETVEEGAEEAELNATGTPGTPAQVTGLTFNQGGDLAWNYIPGVDEYEIRVTDAAGSEYSDDTKDDGAGKQIPKYVTVKGGNIPTYSPSSIKWLKQVALNAATGNYETKKDAQDNEIYANVPGAAYQISVRAVNRYGATGDAVAPSYGDWSAPISYTVPAVAGTITDLAFSYEEKGIYYFTTDAAINGAVYVKMSKTSGFETENIVYDYSVSTTDSKKFAVTDSGLTAGTTYYIKAINTSEYPTTEAWAAAPAVAFTTKAEAALKTITGLTYEYEDNWYYFSFDPVLDKGDYFYEIRYTEDPTLAFETWTLGSLSMHEGQFSIDKTYYVAAATYKWDTNTYEKVYGTLSNVVTIARTAPVSAIGTVTVVERNQNGILFDAGVKPNSEERIEWWISETEDFAAPYTGKDAKTSIGEGGKRFTLYYSDMTPGKTYYVRARVKNNYYKNSDEYKDNGNAYSAFSNVVTVSTSLPNITVSTRGVSNTSLILSIGSEYDEGYLTGFQIQRKNGKKWATLTKTTDDEYKDTGLKKDTAYTYRVRPYYYNEKTGTTTYGTWAYTEATTWGSALKLKATPKTKKAITLTWSKVKGAEGYEIYRCVTDSSSTQVKDGEYNDFSKYTLIKTVKKSKKKYVDKKLTPGVTYSYIVRAFKTVDGKKCYIQDDATASLAFGGYFDYETVQNANGTIKATWTPVTAADGYVIEQKDNTTGEWAVIAKKKATVKTYTFPATTDPDGTTYRIRPYKGSEYMSANEFTVTMYLAAPTGVTAKAAADGSITVTWNAVAGADYYKVFRTTSSHAVYNANLKNNGIYAEDEALVEYVANAAYKSGYEEKDTEIEGTTFVDRPVSYVSNGATITENDGPTAGVKYYYYVKAYKRGTAKNYVEGDYDYIAVTSGVSTMASATVTTTTAAKKPALKAKKITSSKGKVTVQWKKVAGAEGYVIYRSDKKKSGYTIVGSVDKGSTLKYVDGSVTKGKTYYYKVKAVKYNEAGASVLSAFSKVKQIKAK